MSDEHPDYNEYKVLLFTRPDCQICDYLIEKVDDGMDIEIIDVAQLESLPETIRDELVKQVAPMLIFNRHPYKGVSEIKRKLRMYHNQNKELNNTLFVIDRCKRCENILDKFEEKPYEDFDIKVIDVTTEKGYPFLSKARLANNKMPLFYYDGRLYRDLEEIGQLIDEIVTEKPKK